MLLWKVHTDLTIPGLPRVLGVTFVSLVPGLLKMLGVMFVSLVHRQAVRYQYVRLLESLSPAHREFLQQYFWKSRSPLIVQPSRTWYESMEAGGRVMVWPLLFIMLIPG